MACLSINNALGTRCLPQLPTQHAWLFKGKRYCVNARSIDTKDEYTYLEGYIRFIPTDFISISSSIANHLAVYELFCFKQLTPLRRRVHASI